MDTLDDFSTLKQDAELAEPLRRVAYEAGMMLGLEATRDEQAYHRRRGDIFPGNAVDANGQA